MDATLIVAIIGILAAIGLTQKSKISGFLKGHRQAHDTTQSAIKEDVVILKNDIVKKEKEIKKLGDKAKKAEEVIDEIGKSGNEEVQKVLKESNVSNLINDFKKW